VRKVETVRPAGTRVEMNAAGPATDGELGVVDTDLAQEAFERIGGPVDSAMRGMSPSPWFRGRRVAAASSGVSAHGGTDGTVIWRRHLPLWMTSGTLVVAGMFARVKLPSGAVVVITRGLPEGGASHRAHWAPAGSASTKSFGT